MKMVIWREVRSKEACVEGCFVDCYRQGHEVRG